MAHLLQLVQALYGLHHCPLIWPRSLAPLEPLYVTRKSPGLDELLSSRSFNTLVSLAQRYLKGRKYFLGDDLQGFLSDSLARKGDGHRCSWA